MVLGHPLASLLLPDCCGLELFQVHLNQVEIHVVLQHQLPQLRTLDGLFALALCEISILSQNNHAYDIKREHLSVGNHFEDLWYWDGFVCGMRYDEIQWVYISPLGYFIFLGGQPK